MNTLSDAADRKARWPERIAVGRVVKPHGVRGDVALEVWGEFAVSLRPGSEIRVGGDFRRLTSVRGRRDRLIGTFEGCTDRDQAELLRGAVLEVPSSVLPVPRAEDLYLFELEECTVVVGDSELGSVRRVVEDGGGLLLEIVAEPEPDVKDGRPKFYLIPFVKSYLRSTDLIAGRLVFELPEGLLETCVSTS